MSDVLRKYPSPSNDPEYKKYWNVYIESVVARENFKEGHLLQLDILCGLHKEYRKLYEITEVQGYTYHTDSGRYGPQVKTYPEVAQMNQLRTQIAQYVKILGLTLAKDTAPSDETKEEANEWGD